MALIKCFGVIQSTLLEIYETLIGFIKCLQEINIPKNFQDISNDL